MNLFRVTATRANREQLRFATAAEIFCQLTSIARSILLHLLNRSFSVICVVKPYICNLAVVLWIYHPFWPKTTPYPVHLPF